MAFQTALWFASLFAAGVSGAGFAWYLIARLWPARAAADEGGEDIERTVFLLEGAHLLDATAEARAMLAGAPGETDRARLLATLGARFPDLDEALDALPARGHAQLVSRDGMARIAADWTGGHARLTLIRAVQGADLPGPDAQTFAGLLSELDELRGIAEHLPVPVWRRDRDGRIAWANAAYLELAERVSPGDREGSWPPAEVFALADAEDADASGRRVSLDLAEGDAPGWYRCAEVPVRRGMLCTAWPEDGAVSAEKTLGSFVQTLSNAFAHLATGLAIFDESRRLVLFNPAFAELTRLPASYLAGRPGLNQMLDRLREERTAPEPKDFRGWRQRLTEMERGEAAEMRAELWQLPDGRSFRVTVRPQEGGALAFMVADITGELSLSRRFRAELATGQAVLDTLEDGIAVFSADGFLTVTNAAYARIWGHDPMERPMDALTLADAARHWQQAAVPTPVWGDAGDFAARLEARGDWSAEVRLRRGGAVRCRFRQIPGGATLASFRMLAPAEALDEGGGAEALSA